MMRSDAMRMSVDRKDDVGENARLSPVHLVIVDARVPDLTRLIEALPIHTKVVVLPHNKDAPQLHRVLSITRLFTFDPLQGCTWSDMDNLGVCCWTWLVGCEQHRATF